MLLPKLSKPKPKKLMNRKFRLKQLKKMLKMMRMCRPNPNPLTTRNHSGVVMIQKTTKMMNERHRHQHSATKLLTDINNVKIKQFK